MADRLSEIRGDEVTDTLLGRLPPQGHGVAAARQVEDLRGEMHHLFELQTERMTSRWRRDLLLLAIPQFLVLLGIVVSLNV